MKNDPTQRKAKGIIDYIALALTTFGVGYIPGAPGTYGSVVGVVIYHFIGMHLAEAAEHGLQVDLPFGRAVAVAVVAVGDQDRLDVPIVGEGRDVGRRTGAEAASRDHAQDNGRDMRSPHDAITPRLRPPWMALSGAPPWPVVGKRRHGKPQHRNRTIFRRERASSTNSWEDHRGGCGAASAPLSRRLSAADSR